MGRKKKPFIDKKKGTTYHLVPRSQADPLLDDPQEPQHVLKPDKSEVPLTTRDEQLTQQSYYGVHYTDDYDYLQHLREPGTAVLESVTAPSPDGGGMSPAGLPGSMFGSEVKIDGKLSKLLPITGPQPDWDPDIVASLDDPDSNFDIDNQLDDDFVLQANGGEPGVPVYVTDSERGGGGGGEEGEGGVWWMERGEFSVPQQLNDQSESTDTADSESTETDQSKASSTKAGGGEVGSRVIPNWSPPEATFTDYSISSSVVPRNKGLTQLDQRFEKFMAEYDDSELGAPEVEEREGEGDKWLLDMALRDFHKNFTEKVNLVTEGEVSSDGIKERNGGMREGGGEARQREEARVGGEGYSSCDSGEEGESGEEREEREVVRVEVGKPEWDCESILSTYSNLYNHPTKLEEPSSSARGHSPIPLSRKTGLPLGAIPGPLSKEKPGKQMPVTRPRLETTEERRERKKAVKEERKFRRSEKKATKMLFHSEQLRQERLNFNQRKTATVV